MNFLLGLGCVHLVDRSNLRQGSADLLLGIERTVGVLEDHLHVFPQGQQVLAGEVRDIPPLEKDRALGDGLQPEQTPTQGRLAAAGLPHDAEDTALGDGQAHVGHGMQDFPRLTQRFGGHRELLDQALGANDRFRHGHSPPRSGA